MIFFSYHNCDSAFSFRVVAISPYLLFRQLPLLTIVLNYSVWINTKVSAEFGRFTYLSLSVIFSFLPQESVVSTACIHFIRQPVMHGEHCSSFFMFMHYQTYNIDSNEDWTLLLVRLWRIYCLFFLSYHKSLMVKFYFSSKSKSASLKKATSFHLLALRKELTTRN